MRRASAGRRGGRPGGPRLRAAAAMRCIASRAFISTESERGSHRDGVGGAASGRPGRAASPRAVRLTRPSRAASRRARPAWRMRRLGVAMPRGSGWPLEREDAVALQIAERAVVGENVEAVTTWGARRRARPVPPVSAIARVGAQHRARSSAGMPPRDGEQPDRRGGRRRRRARPPRLSSRPRDRSR